MKLRVRKLPILLPLLLVAALLIVAAVMMRLGRDSAAAHTNLGQKYLNDINYTGAITEFLQSLSMDPTVQDARLGLAEAYIASGSPEMAPEILKPLTEAESPEAYRLLIESQRDMDPRQALLTAQKLVERTDSEEDYRLRDELLVRTLMETHSYARGVDYQLAIVGGEVLSIGSNTLGQLGTDRFLGTDQTQDAFQSAQFPGSAARVYCAGRTSCVVDQDGNLWAAGENRWGQMGVSYAAADPQGGWTRIVDSGDAAAAAGSVGRLYVLKTDGSLWYAGQGGEMELRRITGFGKVASIGSNDWQTAVMTVRGELYLSSDNDPMSWMRQARHVKNFCFSGNQLIWVTDENQICSQYGLVQTPDTWTWDSRGVVPNFAVCDIAAGMNGLLLLDASGRLWRIFDGQIYGVDEPLATSIYSTGEVVVVEREDGVAALWDLSQLDWELLQ